MGAFKRGFRCRNPLVLVVAGLLLVPALLGFQWLFTSGVWTTVSLDRALRNRQDSFTYISWMVGKARQQPPRVPGLYLVGGSSARESIVSGAALAAEIKQHGGPSVAAYDLGSINQNFAESLAVLDSVPDTPRAPAWMLVGVNLGRFTETRQTNAVQAQGRELLLDSRAVQSFVSSRWGLEKYQYTILPGIWSYITGWVKGHGADLVEGKPPSTEYELHRYSAATRRSDGQKRRLVTKWNASRRPVFDRNVTANLQMLEELLKQARERDVHVVLVELPLNEQIVGDSFAASQQRYQQPVTALAGKYGVRYIDLNKTLDIPSRDFQDLSHLIAPGRVIWQRALAKELAPLLSTDSGGSSG
jgi:lysophospholipase L1-like esterase